MLIRITNHIFPILAVLFLSAAFSCSRQSSQAPAAIEGSEVLYSAVIAPSQDGTATDSVFVICNSSLLMTGNGPFSVSAWVKGSTRSTVLPYALKRDLDLMDEGAAPILSGSIKIRTSEGRYTAVNIPLGSLEPGFYELALGDSLRFNVGVNPEQIQSPVDAPEDFDAFWESTLAELAEVPMNAVFVRKPEHSSKLRDCFEVFICSLGGAVMGGRIYIPVAEGRYPVRLEYMGYGAPMFWHDPDANPDLIEFLVSVRGQGIFREPEERWIDRGLSSREDFYYRGAFCDVVRAVDFVASLPKADTTRIVAVGESQGGAFSWVSAALSPKVRAIAPAVPFLGDYEDYGRIVWWPVHEMYEQADAEGIDRRDLHDMLRYFDIKNFTPRVSCPVIMAFGLQDPVCPPHTNFSGYNNCASAEKSWHCVPWCGHAMWNEPSWPEKREAFLAQF